MTTLAVASALLASVSLSLTKAEEYRFVEPLCTNLISGVGLDGDSLRYTDAMFLREAFAERYFVATASSQSTPTRTPITNAVLNMSDVYSGVGGKLYLRTLRGLDDGFTQIGNDPIHPPTDLNFIISAAFGGAPELVTLTYNSTDISSVLGSGSPLNKQVLANLYNDVRKFGVLVLKGSLLSSDDWVTAYNERIVDGTFPTAYGENGWEMDEGRDVPYSTSATNRVGSGATPLFEYIVEAYGTNFRGFLRTPGTDNWVPEDTRSSSGYRTYLTAFSYAPVYIPVPADKFRYGCSVENATVLLICGLSVYKYVSMSNTYSNTKVYIMPPKTAINHGTDDNGDCRFQFTITSGDLLSALSNAGEELPTSSDVSEDIDVAEAPKEYDPLKDDGGMTHASGSAECRITIGIDQAILLLSLKFNARVEQ